MTPAGISTLSAVLNGVSAVFVAVGWVAIRRQRQMMHVVCVSVATVTSAGYLACLPYRCFCLGGIPVSLARPGPNRYIYDAALVTHLVASLVLPVLLTAAYVPVWRQHWNVHRRVGRLAMPWWMLASVTGVLVYALG